MGIVFVNMMQHTPLVTDQPIASARCSIPSRYQTFVVDNSDRKGFNSGTRRFNNLTTTDTPGPGHYPDSHKLKERLARNRKRGYPKRRHTTSSINIKPEEFQKTVSSGFSTARDNNSYISMLNASKFSTPGPNNYNVSQYELVDYTGPDREDRASSMFCSNTDRWNMERRQIFNSKTQPGPASYNPKSIGKQSFIFNADRRWIN